MTMISDVSEKILVLGGGATAAAAVRGLTDQGRGVVVATENGGKGPVSRLAGTETAELLSNARPTSCRGHAGDFNVRLEGPEGAVTRRVGSVIIAGDAGRKPLYHLYGLAPSGAVTGLSEFRASAAADAGALKGKTVAFLNGVRSESRAVVAEEAMAAAMGVREAGGRAYVLTGNLKVARNGLEALFHQCREAGVAFVKFTRTAPEIDQSSEGGLVITFQDELTGETFRISPDRIVVDEAVVPGPECKKLADVFGLHRDVNGFLQADNVRRAGVFTNRKGIFAAGGSRSPDAAPEDAADAEEAVAAALSLVDGQTPSCAHPAEITPGCVRCLTCLRSCPYGAIRIGAVLSVMPEACEGCGICTAECPRGVIRIADLTASEMGARIADTLAFEQRPKIIAFCCARSAALAGAAAEEEGRALPDNVKVIQVPCAGGLSMMHMLAAFEKGADGVLVLTCHEGNCHSETGNLMAMKRVGEARAILEKVGAPGKRILLRTLASNMAAAFTDIVTAFEQEIREATK